MSLLGLDLGTSGVRACAFDDAGVLIAQASTRLVPSRPGPGRVELDPDRVLAAACDTVSAVAASDGVRRDPITALATAVLGEAIVPIDRAGQALGPAPVSMDMSGAPFALALAELLGAGRIREITGQSPHPMFSIYKVMAHGPRWRQAGARRFVTMGAYILGRLGASLVSDFSMAARTGAFDITSCSWSKTLLGVTDYSDDELGDVAPAGSIIGKIDARGAAMTGLASGTPIVTGCHDQAAAYIGCGGTPGLVAAFSLGSSDCLTVGSIARPILDEDIGLATYPIQPGHWVTLAGTAAGGWALQWLADMMGARDPAEREELFDSPAASPSNVLALPYLAGAGTYDDDPDARGAIVGLALDTTRDQIVRAFLEAAGYELALIEELVRGAGLRVGEIRAVGGGAASTRALAIRSSSARRTLVPVPGPMAARGAALLGGIGIGRFAGLGDLPPPATAPPVNPDPALTAWYARRIERYRALYRALKDNPPDLVPLRRRAL